jgi:hypothetical protein
MSVFRCRFLGNEAIRETERWVIAVRQFGTAQFMPRPGAVKNENLHDDLICDY